MGTWQTIVPASTLYLALCDPTHAVFSFREPGSFFPYSQLTYDLLPIPGSSLSGIFRVPEALGLCYLLVVGVSQPMPPAGLYQFTRGE